MYNWSTDEEKFKNVGDAVKLLKNQPDVIRVRTLPNKSNADNTVIKVRLSPTTHPAIKTTLAKILQEKSGNLPISVLEE